MTCWRPSPANCSPVRKPMPGRRQRGDGSWLLDGLMPVAELKSRLDIRDLPGDEKGRYNTVAGLLLSVTGHLPVTGEKIEAAGWQFEVVDLDGRRIDKVLARPVPQRADAH
jgi:putative hemolysin